MKYLQNNGFFYGTCGMETNLFDSASGEPLYVGDIVLVFIANDPDYGFFIEPEFVVWDEENDHPFIMGLGRNSKIRRQLITDGDIIAEESFLLDSSRREESLKREDYDTVYDSVICTDADSEWYIKKIKSWKKVVMNECWSGVSLKEK